MTFYKVMVELGKEECDAHQGWGYMDRALCWPRD